MKKFLSLAALAIMLVAAAPAQAQVQFGIKAGMNVTGLKFDKKILDPSNQVGFFVGPTLKVNLPIVNLGVDASVMYDYRAAKFSFHEMDDSKVEETVKQHQVVIPINLRYGFGLGEMAEIYFFAGPQFGFNVGDTDQSVFKDVADWKLKTSNFSINVGVGAMVLNHLQASVNYNIACGNAGEIKFLDGVRNKAKSNAWQIGLAYYF